MTLEEKQELDILIDVIKKNIKVKEIYLFGSFAYGKPTKDSDFDIYVVLPDDSIRPVLATQQLRLSIMPYQKRPVDLLVGKTETFEKRKMTQSFIENEVFKKGVRVA